MSAPAIKDSTRLPRCRIVPPPGWLTGHYRATAALGTTNGSIAAGVVQTTVMSAVHPVVHLLELAIPGCAAGLALPRFRRRPGWSHLELHLERGAAVPAVGPGRRPGSGSSRARCRGGTWAAAEAAAYPAAASPDSDRSR